MSTSDKGLNLDPVRLWREWYQKSEKSWNEMFSQVMGDDQVAKTTGKYLRRRDGRLGHYRSSGD